MLAQNRWCKGAKAFPVFYFQIKSLLHSRVAWIRNDRPIAEGTRSKFHPALKPTHSLPFRKGFCGDINRRLLVEACEPCVCSSQTPFDFILAKLRPEISTSHSV